MVAYIARRISVLLVILFGSSFILYNLSAIAGDPIGDLRFSDDPQVQAEVKELESFLRLDVPPPLRYFIWLRGIFGAFSGNIDFGLTRLRAPVSTEIAAAMPITIRLVLFATIFAVGLGKDELSLVKLLSAILIFAGVYLVTQKRVKSE